MTYSMLYFFISLSFSPFLPCPPQHSLHVSLWTTGSEGLLRGATAHLPHPLHWRARLHQWHRDLHHLGRRSCCHRLGPAACPQNSPAGSHPPCGTEQCHWRLATSCSSGLAWWTLRETQRQWLSFLWICCAHTMDVMCTHTWRDTH